jgi:hypothetical protein
MKFTLIFFSERYKGWQYEYLKKFVVLSHYVGIKRIERSQLIAYKTDRKRA